MPDQIQRMNIVTLEESPFISVIVPLYNEELVIEEMYARLTGFFNDKMMDYEILLVNDGSKDKTLFMAKEICKKNKRVKLISLSRNFGHQIAVTAGMDMASGRVVVIIDADLQDPPEVISEMIQKWKEGYHVVYGVRKKRKGESIFKLVTASAFYRILSRMTSIDIALDAGDFRLIDRKVVDQLNGMREKNRFIRGMVSWVGFRQCGVEYIREERFAGETKYPLKKMIKLAIDGILSFSQTPLRIASFFGMICSVISFLFIVYALIIKIFYSEFAITGWASIFVASLFIGGVQMMCIGIVGEYIGRIYEELKNRPIYIVDEEINF